MKSSRATRVVVFGLDGVGLRTLRSSATPHLDSIAAAGFLAPVVLGDGSPTISGPSWATAEVMAVIPLRNGPPGSRRTCQANART